MNTDLAPKKILIVEADPGSRKLIHRFLSHSKQNYRIESVVDGTTALTVFEQFQPDLVILDVILPDTTGYDLCRQMKNRKGVWVVQLGPADVIGQEWADAYIKKPFYVKDLEKALFGRVDPCFGTVSGPQPLVFGNLAIDPLRREVTLDGRIVPLTPLEFDLLHFLASHPGRVWRRSELIRGVWGYEHRGDRGAEDRVVDLHIGQIRKKIEANASQPTLIKMVRGIGYKMELLDT